MTAALMRTCVLCNRGLEVADVLPVLGRRAHARCAIALQARTDVAVVMMGRALVHVGKLGPWTRVTGSTMEQGDRR